MSRSAHHERRPASGLSARLREATRVQHRTAERSGLMPQLLAGRIDARAYCALLANLHALYAALEDGIDAHADDPAIAPIRLPALYRTDALARDLAVIARVPTPPLAGATRDYVARLDVLGRERPVLLAAHAYVRYLGDLSGGQVLRGVVARMLQLAGGAGTAFYDFGDDESVAALKEALRAGFDALPLSASDADAVVREAQDAFDRHVRLFEELAAE